MTLKSRCLSGIESDSTQIVVVNLEGDAHIQAEVTGKLDRLVITRGYEGSHLEATPKRVAVFPRIMSPYSGTPTLLSSMKEMSMD